MPDETKYTSYPHKIFGMYFLEDMKGDPAEIAGSYEHEQQRWITKEQGQELGNPAGSTHRTNENTGGGTTLPTIYSINGA